MAKRSGRADALLLIGALAALVAGAVGLTGAWGKTEQAAPAARINGEAISESEMDARIAEASKRLQGFRDLPGSRRQVLLELIRLGVMRQAAPELQVATPSQDQSLATAREKMGDKGLEETMSRLGWSTTTFAARWQERAVLAGVLDRVAGETALSPVELRAYYDQHPDLFSVPEKVLLSSALLHSQADAAAAATAVRNGTPFDRMASERSTESHNRASGGRMGWTETKRLPLEVRTALASAPTGALVGPIASPHGYRLFVIEARQPAHRLPYQEVESDVQALARRARAAERVVPWLNRLLDEGSIWVNPRYGTWSRGARMIVPAG